jgi:hypothetical protein
MIDPLVSLAFALHSQKGAYALLLGSGVSRAAQIPTGWEVVLDLISKLATLTGVDCSEDPAAWYRSEFKEEPEYSTLVATLAKSPEERQQLLRRYFEPNDEEREQGLKSPTAAHRAIARLVAAGYIRCIITTNFDRLIERAIEDEGITPTVVSTVDAVDGMLPLMHQRCVVIKIHGDYLDTRIRNAPNELKRYDPRLDALLDRVFDEFGIIVCGWSAQWDDALCDAIDRCKSRRFSTFWASRGELHDRAERIVKARGAERVSIPDADRFFAQLTEKVVSLEDLNQAHPLTVAMAASTTKRLLVDDRNRIRLDDLIRSEVERAFERLQSTLGKLTGTASPALLKDVLERVCVDIEILRTIGAHCGYWGQSYIRRALIEAVERLASDPAAGESGVHLNAVLRSIPAMIVMHTIGVAAVANDNFPMAISVASGPRVNGRRGRKPLIDDLDWERLNGWIKLLPTHARDYQPFAEWMFQDLLKFLSVLIPDHVRLEECYETFELVRSLSFIELSGTDLSTAAHADGRSRIWCPPARIVRKHAQGSRLADEPTFLGDAAKNKDLHEKLAAAGLFKGDGDLVRTATCEIGSFANGVAQHYR